MEENMQALMDRLNSSSQFLQSNDMRVTEVRWFCEGRNDY